MPYDHTAHQPSRRDTSIGCAIILGAMALVGAIAIGLLVGWRSYQCHSQYDGLETRYGPIAGCQVHIQGTSRWIPSRNYREQGQ